MVPHRVAAALFAVCSIPVSAAVAAGVLLAADDLLGETVPSSCGNCGLVVGLMGIWWAPFGFLPGPAAWVADRIYGPDSGVRVARGGGGVNGSVTPSAVDQRARRVSPGEVFPAFAARIGSPGVRLNTQSSGSRSNNSTGFRTGNW